MLSDRNASTHEYDEKAAEKVVLNIKNSYLVVINELYDKLNKLQ
jgi:hypothetical protein